MRWAGLLHRKCGSPAMTAYSLRAWKPSTGMVHRIRAVLVRDVGASRPESHVLVILIGFAGDPFVGEPSPRHFVHGLHFSENLSDFDYQLLEQFIVFPQQCLCFRLGRNP